MASIQKCTIFHLKNMRKGTSFSLIFPVLIVITLAHNCTRILVQLCDTFTLSVKLVNWCVGNRNNSDTQESSGTNMSTDTNVWNFNFCSLDNASKTFLENVFWYIGIRNNSNCQESSDTDMSDSTNVEIFNFCSLGNAYKGNDSKSTNLNKFLMYFLSLDKAHKTLLASLALIF